MSPQVAIEIGIYSGLIPAATALAVYFALGWLLPPQQAERYRWGVAFAVAVLVGFTVAPTTKSLLPSQFWEWIAGLGLVAAFVGGLARAEGVSIGERLVAYLLMAAVAAWVLVPGWERLSETRLEHVAALAVGMFVLAALVEPLADRLAGYAFPFWLMLAAAATAMLILSEWSETIGRSAAMPAGALAGCGVAALVARTSAPVRGLGLPYAVVVGGYAFVGYVYPTPPLTALLVVPFAPLALWLCAWGPAARLTGLPAIMVQALCVLLPLVAVAAYVFATSPGDEW